MEEITVDEYKDKLYKLQQEMTINLAEKDRKIETLKREREMYMSGGNNKIVQVSIEEYKYKLSVLQQEMTNSLAEKDKEIEMLKRDKEMVEFKLKMTNDEVEICKKQTKSLQDDYVLVVNSIKSKLQQKIMEYEKAVLLSPSSTVAHLQNKVQALTNELVAKDALLEKMKQSSSSYYVAEPSSLVKLLQKETETKNALQAHIGFLNLELERLEHDMRKERDDNTMNKIQSAIPASLLTGESTDQLQIKVWSLQQEVKNLREIYFMSLGRALKLQGTLFGWFVNISLHELYEEALECNIKIEKWPAWITTKMQEASTPASNSSSSHDGDDDGLS